MIGQTLAHYRVTAALGAGGMGEVWRATDTKLGREVALKVLPEAFASDPDRLARFEREAKVLASLNHPNIAHLYGLENLEIVEKTVGEGFIPSRDDERAGINPAPTTVHMLVMELVEGDDLSERIKRGPISVDEALPIALQIAEALEAAHEAGIVHRDLKPANIKLTEEGVVKVLDFGLAKAWETEGGDVNSSLSPTLTRHATLEGVILGTAAYMSPEQARGKKVDKRSDIWAYGVVLWEMLTGRRLFSGETVSDVLAAVLTHEPDLESLPAGTPETTRRLLRRCLERDPWRRMRDIGDARILIDDLIAGRGDFGPQASAADPALIAPIWRRALPWVVGLVGLAAGIAGLLRTVPPGTSTDPAPVSRLMIPLPKDAPLFNQGTPSRALALSPDGALVVYVTDPTSPDTRLRLRRLADNEIRSIPGTELAKSPFFSPDGKWLAYFDLAEGALKKISIEGGRAVTLARGFANAGWMLGSWCGDGRIVFDTWNGGLRTVGGDGGEPRALTQPTDEWHLDPQPLPGPSCRVLFYSLGRGEPTIEALSLDSGERVKVLENASHGLYLASGHLLFMREQALFVAPFDALRLKVTGPAIALPIDAVVDFLNVSTPTPQLAVAGNGTLVYGASDPAAGRVTELFSMAASGQTEELGALPFLFPRMALSPNGNLLAVSGRQAGRPKIEVLDLERRTTVSRFETGATDMAMQPVWTPDGSALIYARSGPFDGEIVRHILDGHLPDQTLARVPGTWLCPTSLSADGRYLLVTHYIPETGGDILMVDLQDANGPAVTPLVATGGSQFGGVISPDGRSFAYLSDESGSWDVLIETFPERGQKTRIFSGGKPPIWSPDGKDLYFMTQGSRPGEVTIMAARVESTPALRVAQPRQVFSGSFFPGDDSGQTFAVTADRRFILLRIPAGYSRESGFATELRVVQNWFTELRGETAAAER